MKVITMPSITWDGETFPIPPENQNLIEHSVHVAERVSEKTGLPFEISAMAAFSLTLNDIRTRHHFKKYEFPNCLIGKN